MKKKADTTKKQPIQFKLAPRGTDDPDYANPEVSPNILVPIESSSDANYEKRKREIMAKLGPDGVGVFDEAKKNPDTLEAAMKRMEVMKKYAKEGRKAKFASEKEMEAIREEERRKEAGEDCFDEVKYNAIMHAKSKDPRFYVPELDAETLRQVRALEKKEALINRKLNNMKPAEGVTMVEYDELGKPKSKSTAAKEAKIVIVPDAAEEKPGMLIDEDKKYEELSEDEKEVRDCLNREDEEDGGDLEDDFVMLANEGTPALVDPPACEEKLKTIEEEKVYSDEKEKNSEDDADNEQLNAMVSEYLKKKKAKDNEPVVVKPLHPPENLLPEEMKCEHKEPVISPEVDKKIKARIVEYVEQEHDEAEVVDSSEEEEVKKDWDIESIASTYTNTDNRPKVLVEDLLRERKKSRAIRKEDTGSVQSEVGRKVSGSSKASEEKVSKSLKEMTKEERSAYKKEVKAKQKERRIIKKTMKAAFKDENMKLKKKVIGTGDVVTGTSVKPV